MHKAFISYLFARRLTWQKLSWLAIFALSLLYLSFPSGLSTVDGWYYAASIKYNNEIFQTHHLLYNALGVVFCWITTKAGVEVISALKVMNASFALFILIIIQQILNYFKLTEKQVALIICLCGFSFSLVRFATENETYIVPLFFALLASFNYLKYLDNKSLRNLLNASFWASLSILFHQTYIFWWLGILIGFILERRKRDILIYFLVSLIVPITYLIVILNSQGGLLWNNIVGYIQGDFNNGVRLEITAMGCFFSIANLFRSFVQVHGYIMKLVNENMFLIIPGIISAFFVVYSLFRLPVKGSVNISKRFSTTHIVIGVLQFVFAVLSSGNAEFMVMIPVIVFIITPFYIAYYEAFLFRILVGMAIWNISYGLLPLHYKSQDPEQFICKVAMSVNMPVIIASDDQLIKSMIYYQTGVTFFSNIYQSPAVLRITGNNEIILDKVIVDALSKGTEVYTDCLNERTISRSSIIEGTINYDFFGKYESVLTKSWDFSIGTSSVYRIVRKL